jgi:hypothetical protein
MQAQGSPKRLFWKKKKAKKQVSTDERPVFAEIWPTFEKDRCDNCSSQAKVRVFIPHVAQVLDFCGHHFRKHEKKFHELGYMWVDGRTKKEKFAETLQDISGNL